MSKGKGLSIIEQNLLSQGIRPLPGHETHMSNEINYVLNAIPRDPDNFLSLMTVDRVSHHMSMTEDSLELLLAIAFAPKGEMLEDELRMKCKFSYERKGIGYLTRMNYVKAVSTETHKRKLIVTRGGNMAIFQCTDITRIDYDDFEFIDGRSVSPEDVGLPANLNWDPLCEDDESDCNCVSNVVTRDFIDDIQEVVQSFYEGQDICSTEIILDKKLCQKHNSRFRSACERIDYFNWEIGRKIFLVMLLDHFIKNGPAPMPFAKKNNPLGKGSNDFDTLHQAANRLLADGLICLPPDEAYINDKDTIIRDRFAVSPEIAGLFFKGIKSIEDATVFAIAKQADIITPESISPVELYFDSQFQEKIDSLHNLLDPKNFDGLMKRLAPTGRKGLTCLFSGAPGTGKTQLVKELARRSGRTILSVTPERLNNCFVGDSEKAVKGLFTNYRYLCNVLDRQAILFIDECDGILGRRFANVGRSIDKMENTLQSIFLQELQPQVFSGILIACTNFPGHGNIDPAYDRRMLMKLTFTEPTDEVRARILMTKMKNLSKKDALALCKEFRMTGGQIDNVVSRSILESAIKGRPVKLDGLRRLCRDEVSTDESSTRRPIGF